MDSILLRPSWNSLIQKPTNVLSDILETECGLAGKRGNVSGATRSWTKEEKIYSIISLQNIPKRHTITKIQTHPKDQRIHLNWLFNYYFKASDFDEEWKILCNCGTTTLSKIVVKNGKYKYFVHNNCRKAPNNNNNNNPSSRKRQFLPIFDATKVLILTQKLFTKNGAILEFDNVLQTLKEDCKIDQNEKYIGINDDEEKEEPKQKKTLKKKKIKCLKNNNGANRNKYKRKQPMSSSPDNNNDDNKNNDKQQNDDEQFEPQLKRSKEATDFIRELIKYVDVLGEGSYGKVSLVLYKNGTLCAFKASTKTANIKTEAERIKIFQFKSTYIIGHIDIDWIGTDIPYYSGNDWAGFLMPYGDPKIRVWRRSLTGNEPAICSVSEQLLHNATSAVAAVHEAGFIVVDLKMSNFVIHEDVFKLIDSGGFVKFTGLVNQYTKTKSPPELIISKSKSNTSATPYRAHPTFDIWCLGLMIYEFVSDSRLFHQSDFDALLSAQFNTIVMLNGFIFQNISMSNDMISVVKKMMSYDPQQRYQSCTDILNEPILARYILDEILGQDAIDEQIIKSGYVAPKHDLTKLSALTLSKYYNPFIPQKKK